VGGLEGNGEGRRRARGATQRSVCTLPAAIHVARASGLVSSSAAGGMKTMARRRAWRQQKRGNISMAASGRSGKTSAGGMARAGGDKARRRNKELRAIRTAAKKKVTA